MPERVLQGSGRQRHLVRFTYPTDGGGPGHDLRRRGAIVELWARLGSGEDAAVEYAADDDADVVLLAVGQQVCDRALVEEADTSRDQYAVELHSLEQFERIIGLVHTSSDRSDQTLGLPAARHRRSDLDHLVELVTVVWIV